MQELAAEPCRQNYQAPFLGVAFDVISTAQVHQEMTPLLWPRDQIRRDELGERGDRARQVPSERLRHDGAVGDDRPG